MTTASPTSTSAGPSPVRSDDDHDLGHLVVHLARRLRRHRMNSLEPFGLAAHQARAFMVVGRAEARGDELRLSQLAARLGIAPRSATDVVDALEGLGLVERRRCASDRRATEVRLTDSGRQLRDDLRAARADHSDDLFAGLGPDEQKTLRTLLTKVLATTATDDQEAKRHEQRATGTSAR